MFAAWKWIKWLGLASLVVTVLVLGLKLQVSQNELARVSEQLEKANSDNQTNLNTIATLKGDAARQNALMVQRQRDRIHSEAKLREDISFLTDQLQDIECHVPAAVTERLREPY